jgi:hypothetical protein
MYCSPTGKIRPDRVTSNNEKRGWMMNTYDEVLTIAQQLSPTDKARLLEDISAALRRDLAQAETKTPKRSLLGLWEGVSVSEADIDEARREMWGNFPREDI